MLAHALVVAVVFAALGPAACGGDDDDAVDSGDLGAADSDSVAADSEVDSAIDTGADATVEPDGSDEIGADADGDSAEVAGDTVAGDTVAVDTREVEADVDTREVEAEVDTREVETEGPIERACADLGDDDGDGRVDCDDTDCDGDFACESGPGALGDPCEVARDCAGPSSVCRAEATTGLPGGMCARWCDATVDGSCGPRSVLLRRRLGGSRTVCAALRSLGWHPDLP